MSSHFNEFKSTKAFLNTDLSKEWFDSQNIKELPWNEQKLLMKHKNCPLSVNEMFISSDKWYVRLVAFCSMPHRKHYFEQALKDPKSTVRAAAVKGAYWITDDEALDIVRKDARIQNYFNKDWVSGVYASLTQKSSKLKWALGE